MRSLRSIIASHQQDLRQHRLFDLVRYSSTMAPLASIARAASWWPMVFQDVLRLNVDRVKGTDFERFAVYHRDEDSGHEQWFLQDLEVLGVQAPAFVELFDESFQPIRDACYAIMAEVLRPQTDKQRVALLLALEPTGHVFFEQISAAVDRLGPDLPLRYFARSHLIVEKDHDLFTESTEAALDRIVLDPEERRESELVAGRIFQTFSNVFSYFADCVEQNTRSVSHVNQLGVPVSESPALIRKHGS